jgi:lipopolysaccharide transport system ATP-binding protein
MSDPVIRAENLGKRYRIGERQRYLALRDVLAEALLMPARLFRPASLPSPNGQPRYTWALKDVSLEVREGEVVGIIGRNGAGKTTLLKILARVTKPTEGYAEVRGRMGTLLEVGTGFHPELTGRENVYLSGGILGMSKREIERKFDEIVAFSEVEEFIDTPLKHFSTGMQTRLAFAVAAHLEPEILLVDEVLSVGDLQFQKKCLGKMGDVARQGRTILFVSHQMNQIRRLCQRVVWLDSGGIRQAGRTLEVLAAYEAAAASVSTLGSAANEKTPRGTRFLAWRILEPRHESPNVLDTLGELTIEFVLQVSKAIRHGVHGVALFDSDNQVVWSTSVNHLTLCEGGHRFVFKLPSLPIRPGVYYWHVSIWEGGHPCDIGFCQPELIVATKSLTHPQDEWAGLLNLSSEFHIERDS